MLENLLILTVCQHLMGYFMLILGNHFHFIFIVNFVVFFCVVNTGVRKKYLPKSNICFFIRVFNVTQSKASVRKIKKYLQNSNTRHAVSGAYNIPTAPPKWGKIVIPPKIIEMVCPEFDSQLYLIVRFQFLRSEKIGVPHIAIAPTSTMTRSGSAC